MWKKILKYLKGTKNYEIKRISGESNIKAYANADYGGDTNNQEINIMFFFFDNAWKFTYKLAFKTSAL